MTDTIRLADLDHLGPYAPSRGTPRLPTDTSLDTAYVGMGIWMIHAVVDGHAYGKIFGDLNRSGPLVRHALAIATELHTAGRHNIWFVEYSTWSLTRDGNPNDASNLSEYDEIGAENGSITPGTLDIYRTHFRNRQTATQSEADRMRQELDTVIANEPDPSWAGFYEDVRRQIRPTT